MLNFTGTVNSKVSPGIFDGGGGNGCARWTTPSAAQVSPWHRKIAQQVVRNP
jgi:hypothetical protein